MHFLIVKNAYQTKRTQKLPGTNLATPESLIPIDQTVHNGVKVLYYGPNVKMGERQWGKQRGTICDCWAKMKFFTAVSAQLLAAEFLSH